MQRTTSKPSQSVDQGLRCEEGHTWFQSFKLTEEECKNPKTICDCFAKSVGNTFMYWVHWDETIDSQDIIPELSPIARISSLTFPQRLTDPYVCLDPKDISYYL